MSNIVYLEPNRMDAEPFTTSAVIAEMTGITHRKVRELISKYRTEIETFGKIPRYRVGAGRGNAANYPLNEQQATFLMTLFKNTPVVIAFKAELVRQFYAMRQELTKRKVERAALKPVRREMTDAIKESGADKWAYKHFTDLAYKESVGMTAKQLREARNATEKDAAVDYMTSDEIALVTKRQYQIAVLVDLGYSYATVKQIISTGARLTA